MNRFPAGTRRNGCETAANQPGEGCAHLSKGMALARKLALRSQLVAYSAQYDVFAAEGLHLENARFILSIRLVVAASYRLISIPHVHYEYSLAELGGFKHMGVLVLRCEGKAIRSYV